MHLYLVQIHQSCVRESIPELRFALLVSLLLLLFLLIYYSRLHLLSARSVNFLLNHLSGYC